MTWISPKTNNCINSYTQMSYSSVNQGHVITGTSDCEPRCSTCSWSIEFFFWQTISGGSTPASTRRKRSKVLPWISKPRSTIKLTAASPILGSALQHRRRRLHLLRLETCARQAELNDHDKENA